MIEQVLNPMSGTRYAVRRDATGAIVAAMWLNGNEKERIAQNPAYFANDEDALDEINANRKRLVPQGIIA